MKDLPPQLVLEAYKPDGDLASQRKIDLTDPTYQKLKSLLGADKTGWERSTTSYKTGPYILRGENVIIRCYSDAMIIDVTDSGKSTSVRKRFPNLLQILDLPIT